MASKQLGQENDSSNFHNFLHGDMSNLGKLLNQRHIYHNEVALRKSQLNITSNKNIGRKTVVLERAENEISPSNLEY